MSDNKALTVLDNENEEPVVSQTELGDTDIQEVTSVATDFPHVDETGMVTNTDVDTYTEEEIPQIQSLNDLADKEEAPLFDPNYIASTTPVVANKGVGQSKAGDAGGAGGTSTSGNIDLTKTYDWFKNELLGNTSNMADIYQEGVTPDNFKLKDREDYWNDESYRKPFVETYGEDKGRKMFDEVYDNSQKRLEVFQNGTFDIAATSERRFLPTASNKRLEALGAIKTYTKTRQLMDPSVVPDSIRAEGRDIKYGIVGNPEYSIRSKADENCVRVNGECISFDDYNKKYSNPLVYAKDNMGNYLYEDGHSYLVPLKKGEEIRTFDEYYSRAGDYLGLNGLSTQGSYIATFIPQNLGNFSHSVVDATTSFLKTAGTLMHGDEARDKAMFKFLSDMENISGKYLSMSTSDLAQQDPWSAEALTSMITQIAGQLWLMSAAGGAAGKLATMVGAGTTAAGTIGSTAGLLTSAALASPGMKKAALAAGLSDKEAATLHTLTFGAYMYIGKISGLLMSNNPALRKMLIDASIKKMAGNASLAKGLSGALSAETQMALSKGLANGIKRKSVGLLKSGWKKLQDGTLSLAQNAATSPSKIGQSLSAGVLESGEEMLETTMEQLIKYTYNNIYQPLAAGTALGDAMGTQKDTRFDISWEQLKEELALSAVGGFVGGAGAKRFFLRKHDGSQYNDMYKFIASNEGKSMLDRAKAMHKNGSLASKYVNAEGTSVKEGEKSRNDIAYEAIKRDIDTAQAVWDSHGLNRAYSNNQTKLDFLRNANLAETSIGSDLSNNLIEIDKYTELNAELSKNVGDPGVQEKIDANLKRIAKAEKEITDIRDGKRIKKYVQEVMYNLNPTKMGFETFYNLNSKHKESIEAVQNVVNKVREAEAKPADKLSADDFITKERRDVLLKELTDKYPEELDPETMDVSRGDEYEAQAAKVLHAHDNFVKAADVKDPNSIFYHAYNPETFETAESFDETIASFQDELVQSEQTGDVVFDNVEALETVKSQMEYRLDHLQSLVATNPPTNEAYAKLKEEGTEPTVTIDEFKDIAQGIVDRMAIMDDFIKIAKNNRADFFKTISKANKNYIKNKVARLEDVVSLLSGSTDKYDIEKVLDAVQEHITAATATENYSDAEESIILAEQLLHETFADDKQGILDYLYDLHSLNDENVSGIYHNMNMGIAPSTTRVNTQGEVLAPGSITPTTLRYLKTIITNEPAEFYARYNSLLETVPTEENDSEAWKTSRHVLSPQQRNIVQQAVSFFSDPTKSPISETTQDGMIGITEGIFLASYQGTGKTIMSAWAAKLDQLKRGGKVLVLANDQANQANMQATMEGLGVELGDKTLTPTTLLEHLSSKEQKDVNLIVIDEATLLNLDDVATLDAMVRNINSKRQGNKLKVLYTGDPMQLGSTDSQGTQHNISNGNRAIIPTTEESRFSFRSGNTQINDLLDFQRKRIQLPLSTKSFIGRYDRKGLNGTDLQEDDAFDEAVREVLEQIDENTDYVIIADESKHKHYTETLGVDNTRVLTPAQAQGKQWDKVIIDTDISIDPLLMQDMDKAKSILSAVGRAKQYVLMRVDNSTVDHRTRGLQSAVGESQNIETNISEEIRLKFLEIEKGLMNRLDFPEPVSVSVNINSNVDVEPPKKTTVVTGIERLPLSKDDSEVVKSILKTIKNTYESRFPGNKNKFVPAFSYYTLGRDIENNKALSSIPEALAIKKMLLYPQSGDENKLKNISFSLAVHDGSVDSIIETQPSDWNTKKELPEVSKEDKRIVLYANIEVDGKPYRMSVMVLLRPEEMGLDPKAMYDMEIPLTAKQSEGLLISLRNPVEGAPIQSRRLNHPRYIKDGREMTVQDFIDQNKNFFNFASNIWFDTQSRKKAGKDSNEKNEYLIYSPTIPTRQLDQMLLADPALIDSPDNDIRKIDIDGGEVRGTEEVLLKLKDWATNRDSKVVPKTDFPTLSQGTEIKVLDYALGELGISTSNRQKKAKSLGDKTSNVAAAYQDMVQAKSEKRYGKPITRRQKLMAKAVSFAFVKKTRGGKVKQGTPLDQELRSNYDPKTLTLKNKKGKKTYSKSKSKKSEKGKKRYTVKGDEYLFDPLRMFQKLYKIIQSEPDGSPDAIEAKKIIDDIVADRFKDGFKGQVKTDRYSTSSGPSDVMAPATNVKFKNYKVRGISTPSMPAYTIGLDFLAEVLSNDEGYRLKIETESVFTKEELAEDSAESTEGDTTTPPPDSDTSPSKSYIDTILDKIEVPKNVEQNTTGHRDKAEFQGSALDKKGTTVAIFSKYFDFKPYGFVYPQFVEEFNRRVYQKLFNLQVNANDDPSIVAANLHQAMMEVRDEIERDALPILEAQKVAESRGSTIGHKEILSQSELRPAYFAYVMNQEFDNLLSIKYPGIVLHDGSYKFKVEQYTMNQMDDNAEQISLFTSLNSVISMHLFNTPVLEKQADGTISSNRTFDNRDVLKVTSFARDNDITDIDELTEKLKYTGDASLFSFYHRFLSPEPVVVKNKDGVIETHHSFLSARVADKAAAEDVVTSILSSIASGKELLYATETFDGDNTEMQARFTKIPVNRYRSNLEMAVSKLENTKDITKDGNEITIKYKKYVNGKNRQHSMKLELNPKTGEAKLIDGSHYDIGIVFSSIFNIPYVNFRQHNDVLDIKAKDGTLLTYKIMYGLADYISQEQGSRLATMFSGNALTEWVDWVDAFQSIKGVEGAFGYKNINGDSVNLLTLSSPIIHLNQRIASLNADNAARLDEGNLPNTLANNKFVRTNAEGDTTIDEYMTIDDYYIKEGFKSGLNSKPNTKLSEAEEMVYDFKYLFLNSMKRPNAEIIKNVEGKDVVFHSLLYHPMVYADKSSDYAIRITKQVIPTTGDGNIDLAALRGRVVKGVQDNNIMQALGILKTYMGLEGTLDAESLAELNALANNSDKDAVAEQLIEAFSEMERVLLDESVDEAAKVRIAKLLASSDLPDQLAYAIDKNGHVARLVNPVLLNSLRSTDISNSLNTGKQKFKNQWDETIATYPELDLTDEDMAIVKSYAPDATKEDVLDLFFYNHNEVATEFTGISVGNIAQYKNIGDQVKRNPQITTQRQRFILRGKDYDPKVHSKRRGYKLGATSKVATITDFQRIMTSINYSGVHRQDIYDGAAFHNAYAKKMMKNSYGNNVGFNVASTLKPISTSLNFNTGAVRFDKYASFEITQEMLGDKGDNFIKHVNKLMLSSVEFSVPVMYKGKDTGAKNVYELEEFIMQEEGLTRGGNYDTITDLAMEAMLESSDIDNLLLDQFIQETIFDSSSKTGISNVNVANKNNRDDFQNTESLVYMERDNKNRGLVLDASHDPDTHESILPTQIVSTLLQGNFSSEEASNLTQAIEYIGNFFRGMSETHDVDTYKGKFRDRVNTNNNIGLITKMVNKADFSLNSKSTKNGFFSVIASHLSNITIRFKIKGGQQVVAPASGVFKYVTTTDADGNRVKEERELRGFDAFNGAGESIKKTTEWLNLKNAQDTRISLQRNGDEISTELKQEIESAIRSVQDLLATEYTTLQQPEVILAPTMFSNFNIPKGTELEDINEQLFADIDRRRLVQQNLNKGLTEDLAKSNAQLEVMKRSDDDVYKEKLEEFNRTLNVAVIRIPATNKQSYMSAKIVGFAHDSENTFYTNLDIMYLQGADLDIDKGNILTYETYKGKLPIPTSFAQAKEMHKDILSNLPNNATEAQLEKSLVPFKNFIVQQVLDASEKTINLLESSTPTITDNIQAIADNKAAQNNVNKYVDIFNPFTNATMFVRGRGGMENVGVHAVGMRVYSALYYATREGNVNPVVDYTPKSSALADTNGEPSKPQLKGLDAPNSIEYFNSMMAFSELINAAVDNAKNPILGTVHISGITGGLVNTMTAYGYSPQQIVDFLFEPDIQDTLIEYHKQSLFEPDVPKFITLKSVLEGKEISGALEDLMFFLDMEERYTALGTLTSISGEVENTPYLLYRFLHRLNTALPKDGPSIQEFVNMPEKDRLDIIKTFASDIPSLDLYNVIHYNRHYMSYIKSAVVTESIARANSSMHRIIDNLAHALTSDNAISEKTYKELDNFLYGAAVSDFLKQENKKVNLTVDGVQVEYDLTKLTGDSDSLGRMEFMRDFPQYFMNLQPRRSNSVKDYFMTEPVGEEEDNMTILKLESSFLVQPDEIKLAMVSAVESMNEGVDNDSNPDLISPKGDTAAKQLLFVYSLIKDKGGNSPTSITGLFDVPDFQAFNDFLDTWEPRYTLLGKPNYAGSDFFVAFAGVSTSISAKMRDKMTGKRNSRDSRVPKSMYNFIPYDIQSREVVIDSKLTAVSTAGVKIAKDPTAKFKEDKDLRTGRPYSSTDYTLSVDQNEGVTLGVRSEEEGGAFIVRVGQSTTATSDTDEFVGDVESKAVSKSLATESIAGITDESIKAQMHPELREAVDALRSADTDEDILDVIDEHNYAEGLQTQFSMGNTNVSASAIEVKEVATNKYIIDKTGTTVYAILDQYGNIKKSHGLDEEDNVKGIVYNVATGEVERNNTTQTIKLKRGERLYTISGGLNTEKDIEKFKTTLSKNKTDLDKFLGSKGTNISFAVHEYNNKTKKVTDPRKAPSDSKGKTTPVNGIVLTIDTLEELATEYVTGRDVTSKVNTDGVDIIRVLDADMSDGRVLNFAQQYGYKMRFGSQGLLLISNSYTGTTLDIDNMFESAPFHKAVPLSYFNEKQQKKIYSMSASYKTMQGLVNLINGNGGNVKLMTTSEIEVAYGSKYAKARGFVSPDGYAIVNSDTYSLDTPIHEMGHLWVRALKYSNPELYNKIIDESLQHDMALDVREAYSEHVGTDQEREAIGEEVFAQLFGMNNQVRALDNYNAGFLQKMANTMSEFFTWLNNWISNNLGVNLRNNDTLASVIDRAGASLLSSSYFDFSGKDFSVMRNVGISIDPNTAELLEVKRNLSSKNLISKIC